MLVTRRKLLLGVAVLAVAAVVLTALSAAVLSTYQNLPAIGTIQPASVEPEDNQGAVGSINLDIYSDAAATERCVSIEWGALTAGQTVNKVVYLKNTGNTAEVLNMTATEWTPSSAGDLLVLSWNKEGATLEAGAVMPATLTLQVPADPGQLSAFSLNIVISGTAA